MRKTHRLLGLGTPITRRDFVGAALFGSGAMLLGAPPPARAQGLTTEWNGYAGIGDYARSNGNVASVTNAAHGVRDGIYESRLADAA
jgi:spermidine dehydrogenase